MSEFVFICFLLAHLPLQLTSWFSIFHPLACRKAEKLLGFDCVCIEIDVEKRRGKLEFEMNGMIESNMPLIDRSNGRRFFTKITYVYVMDTYMNRACAIDVPVAISSYQLDIKCNEVGRINSITWHSDITDFPLYSLVRSVSLALLAENCLKSETTTLVGPRANQKTTAKIKESDHHPTLMYDIGVLKYISRHGTSSDWCCVGVTQNMLVVGFFRYEYFFSAVFVHVWGAPSNIHMNVISIDLILTVGVCPYLHWSKWIGGTHYIHMPRAA